jgi:hypothetical protein
MGVVEKRRKWKNNNHDPVLRSSLRELVLATASWPGLVVSCSSTAVSCESLLYPARAGCDLLVLAAYF